MEEVEYPPTSTIALASTIVESLIFMIASNYKLRQKSGKSDKIIFTFALLIINIYKNF